MFPFEVQFGHAGALANSTAQTADAKNTALKAAGAIVPANFNDFVAQINATFNRLVSEKVIRDVPEPDAPKMPMDYAWAKQLGLIRKPASFVSSISDDRGEELLYAGVPISKVRQKGCIMFLIICLLIIHSCPLAADLRGTPRHWWRPGLAVVPSSFTCLCHPVY
jgi:hypothetical protein